MKKLAIVGATILSVVIGNAALAEQPCLVIMEGETKGMWQGPCENGIAYGEGTAILGNATYHGAAQEGRAIGTGRLEFKNGKSHRCEFGGWKIKCPDVELEARPGWLEGAPVKGRAEAAAAGSATEGPSTDRLADDRWDHGAASSDGARDTAGARHDEPVQPTESAASWDRSPSEGIEAPTSGPAAGAEPVSLKVPAPPCKLAFRERVLDWSGGCEKGWASGEGTARGPNGMTYTGKAAQGRPNGFGTVDGPGGYYQGMFENGLRHGRGTYRGDDGEYYKATFENGFQVTEGIPIHDSVPGGDTAAGVREASTHTDRDDAGYNEALEDLDKPDGAADGAASDDSYEGRLADLERREADRKKQLEIEASYREKEREKERRAEANKEKLRKKAEAKEAERTRKELQLGSRAAKSWNRQSGSTPSGTTLFGGGSSKALMDRNRKIIALQSNLNEALARCNKIRPNLGGLYWNPRDGRQAERRAARRQRAEESARLQRSRCVAQARSSYQDAFRSLLMRNP